MASIEFLRECFDYQPDTGFLINKERPRSHFSNNQAFSAWNGKHPGTRAGRYFERGYWVVTILGKARYQHRVIWALVHGINLDDVPDEIDHRDLDPSNNRFDNLRAATRAQNGSNRSLQTNNTSGIKGVDWHKQGKCWRARVTVNNREVMLGLFKEISEAAAARLAAANDLHGTFARAA